MSDTELKDFQYILDGEVETVYGLEKPWQAAYLAAVENVEPRAQPVNTAFGDKDDRREIPVYDLENTVHIYDVQIWNSSEDTESFDTALSRETEAFTMKQEEMSLEKFNRFIQHEDKNYGTTFV
jgi:hypothetical protein